MELRNLVGKYTNKFYRWMAPLFNEPRVAPSTDRCCISFSDKEFSLLHVDQKDQTTTIVSWENFVYNELENLIPFLSGYISKHQLESVPAYWLLAPQDYQLFIIDSLPVVQQEMANALNWRMRSLINYPIEEAIVEHFKLPGKKNSPDNTIAAITAKTKYLSMMVDILKKCHIHLTTIDIPELAMRNLAALYEDDEKSTAFIYFAKQTVIFNITKQKTLYFSRRLNFNLAQENSPKNYEQLCLDILRYLDYYQSQWRHPAPNRIFVAAENDNSTIIADSLEKYLLQPVKAFQLPPIFSSSIVQTKHLLTLGCILRKENTDVATGN